MYFFNRNFTNNTVVTALDGMFSYLGYTVFKPYWTFVKNSY